MTNKYDVIIVGAGIVGQTLAIGVAKQGLSVALVDAGKAPQTLNSAYTGNEFINGKHTAFGARVSAISAASETLLKSLGVWERIARTQPYTHMHVWDEDGFGDIAFDINSIPTIGESRQALGHIVENDIMNYALYEQLLSMPNVTCLYNTNARNMRNDNNEASVNIEQTDGAVITITAKLLVGGDGANSQVRNSFGFAQTFWDYDHNAIVANVHTQHPHNNTARQVFTPFGPLAFLPLPDAHQSSIVFSQQTQQASELMGLDQRDFEKALQVAINNQYGKVTLVTKRVSFPLRMRYAKQWTAHHVAIIGDAAHTIHPLAGQGANLGLLDVSVLLEYIEQYKDTLGEVAMLRKYERRSKAHSIKVIATMEGFKQLFDGKQPIKKLVRNVGLLGANKLPGVKAFFIDQAMG